MAAAFRKLAATMVLSPATARRFATAARRSAAARVAGSERGADRAAAMATLIVTAKLNDVDPQAWLADVLACIADHPAQRLDALLPWIWPHHKGDQPIAEAA